MFKSTQSHRNAAGLGQLEASNQWLEIMQIVPQGQVDNIANDLHEQHHSGDGQDGADELSRAQRGRRQGNGHNERVLTKRTEAIGGWRRRACVLRVIEQ